MEAATARLRGAPAEPAAQRTLDRLRSDRKLAERYHEGDEAAFARIYERHRARVFAICLGVLGSREDAQDALQEVFASVAAELRKQPPRELRPWIARVARNAAIDAARTRRPAATGDEEAADLRALDGTLQAVERRDDLRDLLTGLRDLPEQQRTALVMRELGGDSYADIGARSASTRRPCAASSRAPGSRSRPIARSRWRARSSASASPPRRTDGAGRPRCAGTSRVRWLSRVQRRAQSGRQDAPRAGPHRGRVRAARAHHRVARPEGRRRRRPAGEGRALEGAAQVAVVCVAALCAAAAPSSSKQRHGSGDSLGAGALARGARERVRPYQPRRAAPQCARRRRRRASRGRTGARPRRRDSRPRTGRAPAGATTKPRRPRQAARGRRRAARPPPRARAPTAGSAAGAAAARTSSARAAATAATGARRPRPERRPQRTQSAGDGNPRPEVEAAATAPWQGQGGRGGGVGRPQPAAGGGVAPQVQVQVPQVETPQITAPAPVQAPATGTGGDGS